LRESDVNKLLTLRQNGEVDAFQQRQSFKVVLLDDDEHSYEYVIRMLNELFGYSTTDAYLMAVEVDTTGRVVVLTAPLEQAERARDLIHRYGRDLLMPRSRGPMATILEPA